MAGLVLGVLTAYGQGWMIEDLYWLVNSAGSWTLVAFTAAMLIGGPRWAATAGVLVLVALESGYVLGSNLKGFPSATTTVAFWLFAALAAGPFVGLGGHWARYGRPAQTGLGTGLISGVLIGEGLYSLVRLSAPVCAAGEILVGLMVLCTVSRWRVSSRQSLLLAVTVTAVVAVAFQTVDLINRLVLM